MRQSTSSTSAWSQRATTRSPRERKRTTQCWSAKDEDFVTPRLPDRYALLWRRCGNATNRALIVWLETRWEQIAALLEQGERFVEVR